MNLKKKAGLIIYRFKEKGLEVFLVNSGEADQWEIPQRELDDTQPTALNDEERFIVLDPVQQEDGGVEEAYAAEGDWHEIPSLKAMVYEDAIQIKEKFFEMESGAYFVVKEAFKKVLPHQYKFLKELKDILIDRNSIRDL